ncbi:glycosyltransferase family 4 protein [Pyxidicoccus fallax]|uniref:Glycosyltransferase family 4 protein n=1 Tax=Pyxidicoccus fallax TaxID=394095 RepID=A0A848L5T0_9BACT|nr:glycosyltransferase family 4 protein [Pyxidicoccus fallax]NMO13632.1 glycosyltransferase family 4 protein [Pyxidicoccus fallax]NPC82680.1 glycosyltransferase family 4 protein [Pyxidicoccus fallax]
MKNSVIGRYRRVAYLVSWFPTVTETFILNELRELERLGMRIDVFPLLGRHGYVNHPGTESLVARAHYRRLFAWATFAAQVYWLLRAPGAYLAAWWMALWGNLRSPGFLARAFFVVPKAALFAREMQARGVEHVHAHWATHPALAAMVIQRLTGLTYSFTCHAHDIYVDRTMLREKLEAATFVVTISEFNRQLLGRLYGDAVREKVAVVRCGTDPRMFRPRARRTKLAAVPRLVCVASLRPYKGHPFLLEACRKLKERGRTFRLMLVGDGVERPRLEKLIAEAGLSEEVKLLGSRPHNEVAALVAQADVVVQPSIVASTGQMEGIPVSLMEALASEAPVVATRISAIPELIEHERTGLLVPEQDAGALADAIERLMMDRELATRLGREGRRHVLAHYSLRGNVRSLSELFLELRVPGPLDSPRKLLAAAREVVASSPRAVPTHQEPREPAGVGKRARRGDTRTAPRN